MLRCEKCNNEHDGAFGSGRFCSRPCSNARIRSDDVKLKISKGMKKAYVEGRASRPQLTKEQIRNIANKKRLQANTNILKADITTLSFGRLRKRILLEQDNKCNRCGIDSWLDNPLTLELEHKNGNHSDDERENLEALCPNCHSLTDTWRGRNKTSCQAKQKSVTDEELVTYYLETGNIRQTLLKAGMAAKGANYGRVKRALTLWEINY